MTAALLAAGLLPQTACFNNPSLYPLYTEETIAFDASLAGLWRTGEKDFLIITPAEDRRSYAVVSISGDDAMRFDVHLVRLGGAQVADLLPEESGGNIPGHSFALIESDPDRLRVSFLDSDEFRAAAVERKIGFSVAKGQAVLVAPAADLQRFVAQHLAESRGRKADTVEYTRFR